MDIRELSLRDLLLAIVAIGIIGLIAELLLLDHTETFTQWIPLISLLLGLLVTGAVAKDPRPATLRAFQVMMALFIIAGTLGLYFHYAGNVEFALERDPEMGGVGLVWKALRGATPALAPGAMVQLGLIGLVYTHRHPGGDSEYEGSA